MLQYFKDKKVFGITGGIGSGKTEVAKLIEILGYPVYYSDIRAKELVNSNIELKKDIIDLLGENAYDSEGKYNRKWVAQQIFGNDELLLRLNALIHPVVKLDFEEWLRQQETEFVFKETALLFELNLDRDCYQSVLVTADDNIRIKRVMDRDGRTYREVEAIINRQMPEREKCNRADIIIYNNGTLEELKRETENILEKIRNY